MTTSRLALGSSTMTTTVWDPPSPEAMVRLLQKLGYKVIEPPTADVGGRAALAYVLGQIVMSMGPDFDFESSDPTTGTIVLLSSRRRWQMVLAELSDD